MHAKVTYQDLQQHLQNCTPVVRGLAHLLVHFAFHPPAAGSVGITLVELYLLSLSCLPNCVEVDSPAVAAAQPNIFR
eukprot:3346263-Karenia_brevis.AAC.1